MKQTAWRPIKDSNACRFTTRLKRLELLIP